MYSMGDRDTTNYTNQNAMFSYSTPSNWPLCCVPNQAACGFDNRQLRPIYTSSHFGGINEYSRFRPNNTSQYGAYSFSNANSGTNGCSSYYNGQAMESENIPDEKEQHPSRASTPGTYIDLSGCGNQAFKIPPTSYSNPLRTSQTNIWNGGTTIRFMDERYPHASSQILENPVELLSASATNNQSDERASQNANLPSTLTVSEKQINTTKENVQGKIVVSVAGLHLFSMDLQNNSATDAPVKRKRGRPRKQPMIPFVVPEERRNKRRYKAGTSHFQIHQHAPGSEPQVAAPLSLLPTVNSSRSIASSPISNNDDSSSEILDVVTLDENDIAAQMTPNRLGDTILEQLRNASTEANLNASNESDKIDPIGESSTDRAQQHSIQEKIASQNTPIGTAAAAAETQMMVKDASVPTPALLIPIIPAHQTALCDQFTQTEEEIFNSLKRKPKAKVYYATDARIRRFMNSELRSKKKSKSQARQEEQENINEQNSNNNSNAEKNRNGVEVIEEEPTLSETREPPPCIDMPNLFLGTSQTDSTNDNPETDAANDDPDGPVAGGSLIEAATISVEAELTTIDSVDESVANANPPAIIPDLRQQLILSDDSDSEPEDSNNSGKGSDDASTEICATVDSTAEIPTPVSTLSLSKGNEADKPSTQEDCASDEEDDAICFHASPDPIIIPESEPTPQLSQCPNEVESSSNNANDNTQTSLETLSNEFEPVQFIPVRVANEGRHSIGNNIPNLMISNTFRPIQAFPLTTKGKEGSFSRIKRPQKRYSVGSNVPTEQFNTGGRKRYTGNAAKLLRIGNRFKKVEAIIAANNKKDITRTDLNNKVVDHASSAFIGIGPTTLESARASIACGCDHICETLHVVQNPNAETEKANFERKSIAGNKLKCSQSQSLPAKKKVATKRKGSDANLPNDEDSWKKPKNIVGTSKIAPIVKKLIRESSKGVKARKNAINKTKTKLNSDLNKFFVLGEHPTGNVRHPTTRLKGSLAGQLKEVVLQIPGPMERRSKTDPLRKAMIRTKSVVKPQSSKPIAKKPKKTNTKPTKKPLKKPCKPAAKTNHLSDSEDEAMNSASTWEMMACTRKTGHTTLDHRQKQIGTKGKSCGELHLSEDSDSDDDDDYDNDDMDILDLHAERDSLIDNMLN